MFIFLVRAENRDLLVIVESKEFRVLRDHMDYQENKAVLVHKGNKDFQDYKGHQVLKEIKDLQVFVESKVFRVLRGYRDYQDYKVLQVLKGSKAHQAPSLTSPLYQRLLDILIFLAQT
ncbi:hypothetical protein [Cohnella kolymensis]|uniref:hypothetical protein n=1 Tax=Cohnella kolymensis TaxID=1590652 RepID=UPI00069655AF|nr:hypothetical protein [Cohnella kolymensis]